MATLDSLPKLIEESPQVREDFLSTLIAFCQRHGIEAAPEDFVGLSEGPAVDTGGHVLQATGVQGATGGLVINPPQVLIYRDGPRYSRWIWSG